MVSISKIETGLAKFIDSELIDKLELNGWKRLVTASVSSIFIKNFLTYYLNFKRTLS